MQKEIRILSFDRGIVENFNQKELLKEGYYDSVLYLCNYDPNKEIRSLVKREGQKIYSPSSTKLDILDYLTDKTTNKSNLVLHAKLLKTANPKINDTYVIFFKRRVESDGDDYYIGDIGLGTYVEATGILGFTYKYDGNNYETGWHEIFRDNNVNSVPFPGWYPLGTLMDSCRYGESLLFVTKLLNEYPDNTKTKADKLMFPVYMWKNWDLTKKLENDNQFWNGLGLTLAKEDYNLWKVYEPSVNMENMTGLAFADTQGIRKYVNGNVDDNAELSDISLVLWENDLYCNPYFDKLKDNSDPPNSLETLKNVPLYSTFEVLNGDKVEKLMLNCIKDEIGENAAIDDASTPIAQDYYYYYAKTDINIKTFLATDDTTVKVIPIGRIRYHAQETREILKKDVYSVVTTCLPDYSKGYLPRMWLKEERIPILVTYVINGIEVIALKDDYIIRNGAIPLSSSMSNFRRTTDMLCSGTIRAAVRLNLETNENSPQFDGKNMWIAPCYSASKEHDDSERTNILFEGETYLYPVLYMTLRITEEGYKKIISTGVSSIKVYVSEPDVKNGWLRSQGVDAYISPPDAYMFPAIKNNKSPDSNSHYRLAKEFIIDGLGDNIDDTANIEVNDYAVNKRSTNAWKKTTDIVNSTEEVYYAIPQEGAIEVNGHRYPEARDITNANFNPFVVGAIREFNDDPDDSQKDQYWTPDFLLWDYPSARTPLNLQSSGKIWKGTGANCICVIKGRTFIATDEQAILRYSNVQGGVIAPDVFIEEEKIQIGHEPITALMEFREQLLVFNRNQHYRIIMPNIADVSTWEFAEAIESAGTYSPKTIINTPHGFIYGNENGVWISQGGLPESISNNVESMLLINGIWALLMYAKPYIYTNLYDVGEILIEEKGYNEYLEFNYETENNELVISTPTGSYTENIWAFTHEIRLIFNFANKNWRIEKYNITRDQDYITVPDAIVCYSKYHRTKFNNGKIYSLVYQYGLNWDDSITYYGYNDKTSLKDEYPVNTTGIESDNNSKRDITGEIVTHEIGDGINDFQLHSAIIECVPYDITTQVDLTDHDFLCDPVFSVETRNRQWVDQAKAMYRKIKMKYNPTGTEELIELLSNSGWYDLIKHNMIAKGTNNPFLGMMQLPTATGGEFYDDENTKQGVGRESINVLSPIGIKGRLMRFKFISELTAKLKTIQIKVNIYKRRIQ